MRGWIGKGTGLWFYLLWKRAHKAVLLVSHKDRERSFTCTLQHCKMSENNWYGHKCWCDKQDQRGKGLPFTTSGHACADSRAHTGLIQPGHVPDTENKAGTAEDWEHLSTGILHHLLGIMAKPHICVSLLWTGLSALWCCCLPDPSFPGLVAKPS